MNSGNEVRTSSKKNEDIVLEEMDEQDFLMSKLQAFKYYKERKKVFFNLSSMLEIEKVEEAE